MLNAPDAIMPVDLPKLSAGQVECDNLLATRGGNGSAILGERDLRLAPAPADRVPDPCVRYACVAGEAAFVLSVAERRLPALYPEGVADVPLSGLPAPLAKALATVAFRPLMDGIDDCLGGRIVLEGTRHDVPPDWRLLGLYAGGDDSLQPLAIMHLSPEADGRLTEKLRVLPIGAAWPEASTIPATVSFCLRGFVLSRSECARLRSGGAILLPRETDPNRLSILLGARSQLVGFGRPENDKVIVEDLTVGAMNDENEDRSDDTEEGAPAGATLDDVGVRIDFMVGQTVMTFAELQALTPGFAIKLDTPVSQSVKIMASGRVIGEGELVQIDDRLGVRVVRLAEKKDG